MPEPERAGPEFVVEQLVEQALGSIEEYFSIPHVLAELLRLVDDPNTSAEELSRMIEADPSLTIRVLRVVNSPAFGFRKTVTSVREATILLGFNEVKHICITRALKSRLLATRGQDVIIPREKFWHHSVATAVFAKLLSKYGGVDVGTAYVSGLLHDIGWVAIELALPEATRRILDIAEREGTWNEDVELQLLGFNHADAGAWLLKRWGLPELLRNITLFHHHPAEAGDQEREAWVVSLSDALAAVCLPFYADHLIPEEPEEGAWEALGLSPAVREVVLVKFSEEMAKLGEILRL